MVASLNFDNVATLEGLEGLKDSNNLYYYYRYAQIIDRPLYKCLCLISSIVFNKYTSEETLSTEIRLCNRISCREYIKINLKNIFFMYSRSATKLPYKKHIFLYRQLRAFLAKRYSNLLSYSQRDTSNNGYFQKSKKTKTEIKTEKTKAKTKFKGTKAK